MRMTDEKEMHQLLLPDRRPVVDRLSAGVEIVPISMPDDAMTIADRIDCHVQGAKCIMWCRHQDQPRHSLEETHLRYLLYVQPFAAWRRSFCRIRHARLRNHADKGQPASHVVSIRSGEASKATTLSNCMKKKEIVTIPYINKNDSILLTKSPVDGVTMGPVPSAP